jgi:hypothetical protein
MISFEVARPAFHRGSKRRRGQPAAAVCACVRGVACRPASQASAPLCNGERGSVGSLPYLHPPSRRANSAAASGRESQRLHAEGCDGSRPAGLSAADGCRDTDVKDCEAVTLSTDRLPAFATATSRLPGVASASRVLLRRPSCLVITRLISLNAPISTAVVRPIQRHQGSTRVHARNWRFLPIPAQFLTSAPMQVSAANIMV